MNNTWRWKNQYIDKLAEKAGYIISVADADSVLRGKTEIAQKATQFKDIVVELGSGSGLHLIERAALRPDCLHIGFEIRYKRTFRTAEKAERDGLKNLLVLHCDANLFSQLFEPGSIAALYVNFPDPWAKKRWRKHRLLREDTLKNIREILKTGGKFCYKTDHAEYFRETMTLLTLMKEFDLKTVTYDFYHEAPVVDSVPTEFELLFRSKGIPICLVEAIRKQ